MKSRGTILSYRPDVRVVDATVRDGGLVNDFRFTDEFVKNLYQANMKAGVDYMEFGYKASKDIFPGRRLWSLEILQRGGYPQDRRRKGLRYENCCYGRCRAY